jgi:quercetin dioxygenase-like cupin family protein
MHGFPVSGCRNNSGQPGEYPGISPLNYVSDHSIDPDEQEKEELRKNYVPVQKNRPDIMILKHASDVPAEPVTKPGFSGMHARFLLTAEDGCPRYALRLMEIAPGGCTSSHSHKEEHEMFFLEGEGMLRTGDGNECRIRAGDALLLMPCELHQIRNTGTCMLKMICTVPLLPGKTGKETTPCL